MPLKELIEDLKVFQQQGRKALVVFDLDSTLFDVSPRLERILIDFANEPEFQERFPDSIEILKNIKMLRSDWGIKGALIRAGLESHSDDFHTTIRDYWKLKFFSNEYVHYDTPYEGAPEFVQEIWKLKADIAYLTGRDVHRMGKGSADVLVKWQFPLDERARLVLKPEKGMDDAEFKTNWFKALPANQYEKIWFFENEPVNLNHLRRHLPQIEVVFFESTHSGKETPPEDIPRIMDYLAAKKIGDSDEGPL